MATVKRFEDLEIWQEARRISSIIIEITKETELNTNYKLKDQINGSAGSVMDNIAEGFDRDGTREFIQFLSIAKASCSETRSQLYRVYDFGYINTEVFKNILEDCETLSKRIASFMNYLKKSNFKGNKYK